MCGRLSLDAELVDLAAQLQFNPAPGAAIAANRDVRPTDPILIIDQQRVGRVVSWGLPNGRDAKRPFFNARAETVHQKPTFRRPFRESRCLVVATGWYEWDARKRRVRIGRADGSPIMLAGIWNGYSRPATAAVITTAPNSLLRPIHNRMPALLDASAAAQWLNAYSAQERLLELLASREWDDMVAEPDNSLPTPSPTQETLFLPNAMTT